MYGFEQRSQRGISLIEVLIVLVVLGILVTFAIARFGSASGNLDRQNIAREFKVFLERARFDSIKRRANVCSDMSRVTITDATTFALSIDLNQDGTLQPATETRTISLGSQSNVKIVGNGVTLPITIRFDERGHSFLYSDCAASPDANVPLVYFCNGTCTSATATSQNANVIFVSPTGTVAMLPGNETMPSFSAPTVSNVTTNANVNPRLTVWSPTTPTPTPTVTPTPTPTPVATPVPVYCPVSPWEKPSETGCTCKLPMWVRSNGQCK
jgi:prepilin-type N-terminal cleavage/methylation domain-containing protein